MSLRLIEKNEKHVEAITKEAGHACDLPVSGDAWIAKASFLHTSPHNPEAAQSAFRHARQNRVVFLRDHTSRDPEPSPIRAAVAGLRDPAASARHSTLVAAIVAGALAQGCSVACPPDACSRLAAHDVSARRDRAVKRAVRDALSRLRHPYLRCTRALRKFALQEIRTCAD